MGTVTTVGFKNLKTAEVNTKMARIIQYGLCAFLGLGFMSGCTHKKNHKSAKGAKVASGSKAKKSKSNKKHLDWVDPGGAKWRYFKQKRPWTKARSKCKNLSKSSDTLWRLPNPEELLRARQQGITSSKNAKFGWIYLHNTWTVNWESAYDQKAAVYVNMDNGRQSRTTFDHDFTVLCVKPKQGATRYTWVDSKTGMVWRFHPHKSRWDASQKVCRTFGQWEKKPWRLPSQSELTEAVKNGIQTPSNQAFGGDYLTHTWSFEGEAEYPDEAYAIDLRNDHRFLFSKDSAVSVLCIRPLAH